MILLLFDFEGKFLSSTPQTGFISLLAYNLELFKHEQNDIQSSFSKPNRIYSRLKVACVLVNTLHQNDYRLITAYLLLRVNLDKIIHARWDFDSASARTRRVSALDKHQNWSASALFCLNSRAQSKHAAVNLIHTRRKQTFLSFIMW